MLLIFNIFWKIMLESCITSPLEFVTNRQITIIKKRNSTEYENSTIMFESCGSQCVQSSAEKATLAM